MRTRTLVELIDLMQPAPVELFGDDVLVGEEVVIDNRLATPGSVFVAIPGERVDGHDFASAAVEAGAAAVIGNYVTAAPVPHILAGDSVEALSWLARGLVRAERARGMLSFGVTGSSGKTSTKDLLAQILERAGETVSPVGSQNNEIGVPLTACRVNEQTKFLVSEMGARGKGHIAWLTSLVGLDVGICLNVGHAHVGEFGSIEQTAVAKSEIVAGLAETGWAVLNANDPAVAKMSADTAAQVAWFGEGTIPLGDAQVLAREVELNALSQASFELVAQRAGSAPETARVSLQVVGRHQVSNALAAAAAAFVAGLSVEQIGAALSSAVARSDWRMALTQRPDGVLILNDSYNANPDSMQAGLETAAQLVTGSRAAYPSAKLFAVLGDMLELGGSEASLHEQVGESAAALGVAEVIAVGKMAPQVVAGARRGGTSARVADRAEAAASLTLSPGDVVLIKGSRGIGLEQVAAALVAGDGEAS